MTRERAEAEFLRLVKGYGLSPDNPEHGWKMAFALFMRWSPPMRRRSKPGRQPSSELQDLILLAGFHHAELHGDKRDPVKIIRDIARWNGWRTDKAAIQTLRSRYRYLKEPTHSYRRNAVEALRRSMPKELWKTEKS